MKLLVFGSTGQVARELQRLAPSADYLGRDRADLSDPAACATAIHAIRPQAVINAAAWTAVDKAEAEEDAALLVNGAAPTAMAVTCAELGIPLVHISTDYVFDGSGDAFCARSCHCALGRMAGPSWPVKRASGPRVQLMPSCAHPWVFSAHGANFVKTMLRLGARRSPA